MDPFTIYVGQALTNAPAWFSTTFQLALKAGLRAIPNVVVLDFVGLENGTALVVYRHDKKCTLEADLCAFILDEASTGLGMEVVFRDASGKPALFFAATGKRITRMILGYLEETGQTLHRYDSVEEIVEIVRENMLAKHPQYRP